MEPEELQEIVDAAIANPAEASSQAGSVKQHSLKDLLDAQDRLARKGKRVRTVKFKTAGIVRTNCDE